MEENKNRYELIIGFVTLILSFSAFKDELGAVELNLGFYKFTLADYLLKIVYGFGICIYLYIIERVSRQSKRLNAWKVLDYIEKFAFAFFVFIILSPFLLGIVYLIYFAFDRYTHMDEEQKASLVSVFSVVLSMVSGIISVLTTFMYYRTKNKNLQEEIEKAEILELENAIKLYESNFYSQSILEAFKALESHLIKLFGQRRINIPRHQFNFNDLFNYAIKLGLLDSDDITSVHEIRKMRNSAAHLDIEHTKEQATKTIEFIKYLIQKTSDNDKKNN